MMGEWRVMQEALFYGFSLERHVPDGHMLRKIDRFVDVAGVRAHLEPYYSNVGRPRRRRSRSAYRTDPPRSRGNGLLRRDQASGRRR